MIASLLLSGWVAAAAAWTPFTSFSLTCSGSQTAYQENGGSKQTLPWKETFFVDLARGSYCSNLCSMVVPLSALRTDGLDLQASVAQYDTTLKSYQAATSVMTNTLIVAASPTDRFHLEQTGVCQLSPTGGRS